MSLKFETPSNESNQSNTDDVVSQMLLSCAFDKPPTSSNNDSSTLSLGNLLQTSDLSKTPLGSNLHRSSSDSSPISSNLGSILPGVKIVGLGDNSAPPSKRPQSKPHESSGTPDNSAPTPSRPQSKPHESGGTPDNSAPTPSRPHSRSHESGSAPENSVPTPSRPHSRSHESGGTPDNSAPTTESRPQSKPPENGSGTDNTSPKTQSRPQSRPEENGSGTDNLAPKFPKFDRSPKFKFPEDKPLDKTADEMADKVAKWIKESVDQDGNLKLDMNTLDRLKDALQYGVSHGEKGLQEMVAKINKKLEGSGVEIKTDGKAFAHYQTCMPQIERGDHLGDFIGFDVMKNGQKVDSNLVKVGPGDLDRIRY